MSVAKVAVGLVHWPIYDRMKKQVATNITNLDIHDIARSTRVYGVDRYYIIHPMREQQMFVHRVLDHWRSGRGATFNPMRRTALMDVYTADSIRAAKLDWQEVCGGVASHCVATSARDEVGLAQIGFRQLRSEMGQQTQRPIFLLFGTGFGLHEDAFLEVDSILEPIRGASREDYRHLSVRSAVSICLDRLLGSW